VWTDPIVEEVRKIRNDYAAQFNYDLDAIFQDIQARERESGEPVVRLEPRRCSKSDNSVPMSRAA
jgi:hypothetical protein